MVKESAAQRKLRLEKAKQKRQEKLQMESEASRCARLAARRKRAEAVSEDQRNVERAKAKQRMARVRRNETEDPHSSRLAKDAQRHAQVRANETADKHISRLERQRQAQSRVIKSADEHVSRLAADVFRHGQTRANETIEHHISRLESEGIAWIRDVILECETESEDDEYITIYKIIDYETPPIPTADRHSCSNPPSPSNVENDSQETDKHNFNEINTSPPSSQSNMETVSQETYISPNIGGSITIKTEPLSNDEPMETNGEQTSRYFLSEEDVIVEIGASPSPSSDINTEEDINTAILFERSVEYVMENNNGTNASQRSTGLAIGHTAEELDENIKPAIIFQNADELIMENNNPQKNCHHRPQSLPTGKRPRPGSPLPYIDTLEEALRHLNVLENYVKLKENLWAISLIKQLEKAIEK